ncbi:lipid A deacylase LpxR family protein [Pseudothauera nasutitermitis]|uniref:Lipid A deacylase LpxR family protein n=1 Tax=Pseudothauera nasutitermitis TaxID=2565930 RepID=A0A4S4AXV0_9RHOO|nr:lipid A deacylase LpxR family protein [Pseudothauera nasutitermitis]
MRRLVKCWRTQRLRAARATGVLLAIAAGAAAGETSQCASNPTRLADQSTLNFRIDNDLFGGLGQDQGYSNGFLVTWVSPNLGDYVDDPCLPASMRRLNRYLEWLNPAGFDEQNMTMGIGQLLFTPTDRTRTDLIRDDRPYAAALLYGWGYNARRGDHLRTSQVRIGMVGPSAKGRQVQDWWHGIIGTDRFQGWGNQLRDEPVFQILHERRNRIARHESPSGWGWDAIGHWGGSFGNFATYANAGGEWRFGYRLPDDLGTAPLRPGGENMSPVRVHPTQMWNTHLFVALDTRWVLRDITLDGNTFKTSHSVDKRPLVADLGYGVAVTRGTWRFAFARYHRTREFNGQREVPTYGTVTIGKRF